MSGVIIAAIVVGAAGIGLGFFLAFMSKKFAVEVDEREEQVRELLPGNNCGACGYPGCDGAAVAMCKGEAPVTACPVGGPSVADQIAAILGGSAGATEKKVAFVKCAGDCDKAKDLYDYDGVKTCAIVSSVPGGGAKGCSYGCRGFGDCVEACDFDAIHIVNGIAVVDREKCVACEACVKACPKNLIEMIPYKRTAAVSCYSNDSAKDVMAVCKAGCIGCKICEKECPIPDGAIHVEKNLAKVDYKKCVGCGKCAAKCPKKVIEMFAVKKK